MDIKEPFEKEYCKINRNFTKENNAFYLRKNSLHLDRYAEYQVQCLFDMYKAGYEAHQAELTSLRHQLAEQPKVDVLVETLRVANSALDTCKINIDHSELEQHSFEFDENAVFNAKLKIFAALATYQSKNEKE